MTADAEATKSLKQRLRLRELAKYYCAASPIPGLTLHTGHGCVRPLGPGATFKPLSARLSSDGILTALAQLAALRLGFQRSIISIIDDDAQHIIAEATRSISVVDEHDHDLDDGLIFGAQSLPITYGMCPTTLDAFHDERHLSLDVPSNSADRDHIVINDLLEESRTRNVPALMKLPPILRCYVEVPLRSDSGYLIGSICVIDPQVRQIGPKDVKKLQQVAKLVCDHLEMTRMKEDHGRAQRLMEGLSHFIQGKDSISDWSKATSGQENIPNVYPERGRLSIGTMSSVGTGDRPSENLSASVTASNSNSNLFSDATVTATTPATSGDTPPAGPPSSSMGTDVEIGFDPLPTQSSSEDLSTATLASVSVRQAFSRASNLIRESMDLDATCFLEVPQNERFKNPTQRKKSAQLSSEDDSANASTSESDSLTDSSSDATPKDQERPGSVETSAPKNVLCHRLGFATRTKSSLAGSSTTQPYLTISASLLNRLTDKYPKGHIFHFDVVGSVSSGDDSQQGQQQTKLTRRTRKTKLSAHLFRLFPTARSLIFFPMYDNDKQQVYSGFLGWTTDPTRALQKHEIVYVSGFTNSIMCEVMRLEATATDKAKSDFISSISHELRSPLHGILAAAQLLAESKIYPKQAEFIQMVDTCARTLLDIMNHLLDHAKINHFANQQTKKPRPKMVGRTNSKTFSLVTSMDLLSVVEETTASMAASSNQMLRKGRRSTAGVTPLGDASAFDNQERLSLPIMLNIAPHKHWTFDSEAGSWRRIIMNLIGNSLKYTQEGHINVTLQLKEQRKTGTSIAELKIADTGQGISEEYLKHRLYTAFAQENNLSVGAGLGLSLVQKMVATLKGEIQVHSEVGTGTEIIVRVPLTAAEPSSEAQTPAVEKNQELLSMAKNKTFSFVGFDERPSIYEQPTGIPHPHTRALMTMKESLSATMTGWYGMRPRSSDGEVCIVEESYLETKLKTFDRHDKNLLVVGMDGRGTTTDKIVNANFVYLLPPVGPIRMAHALKALLTTRKNMSHAQLHDAQPIKQDKAPPVRPQITSPGPYNSPDSQTSTPKPRSPSAVPGPAPNMSTAYPLVEPVNTVSREGSDSGSDTSKEAILLVDDNEINLRILVTCVNRLKRQNIEYLTARNGQDALDKYVAATQAGNKVSTVFMDISMPIMDGFASTREIRAFERRIGMKRNLRSRIVALTGLASAEAQHEIENCGFDLYLRKPVNLKTVREILAEEDTGSVGSP